MAMKKIVKSEYSYTYYKKKKTLRKPYTCKWCGKQHYKGSKVARQHQKLLKQYANKKPKTQTRKKARYVFYKIQFRKTKNSKWVTPRTLYYGEVKNHFKTKNKARIWFLKNTTYALANTSNIYSVRFIAFYKR